MHTGHIFPETKKKKSEAHHVVCQPFFGPVFDKLVGWFLGGCSPRLPRGDGSSRSLFISCCVQALTDDVGVILEDRTVGRLRAWPNLGCSGHVCLVSEQGLQRQPSAQIERAHFSSSIFIRRFWWRTGHYKLSLPKDLRGCSTKDLWHANADMTDLGVGRLFHRIEIDDARPSPRLATKKKATV